jgi:hypothetical protein
MSKSTDPWTWTETDFESWRTAVDTRLRQIYAISIVDSGADDDYLKYNWALQQAPYEFVEWFGNKYDLDPVSLFGVKHA